MVNRPPLIPQCAVSHPARYQKTAFCGHNIVPQNAALYSPQRGRRHRIAAHSHPHALRQAESLSRTTVEQQPTGRRRRHQAPTQ